MDIFQQSAPRNFARNAQACCALAALFTLGISESFAAPTFYDTSAANASNWQVSTRTGCCDGQLSSFSTSNFQTAAALPGRTGWIANTPSGNNSTWTFFVFRQTFDLTGYDSTTAGLKFQWAADDSGEVFASRGSWVPKFSLNGGSMVPWGTGATYSFGPTVDLHSGFVSGLNTIDFYVEGNGTTDGFALTLGPGGGLTAAVPEPESYAMLMVGLGLMGAVARRRKSKQA